MKRSPFKERIGFLTLVVATGVDFNDKPAAHE
jgi:hypothetical protein